VNKRNQSGVFLE